MIAKKIIIPVGFNAEQCKRGVLSYFADDINTEWMSDQDFVQQYLYCQEDGDCDPPIEVWLLVWDSPSKMLISPQGGYSALYLKCLAVGVNLTWCKKPSQRPYRPRHQSVTACNRRKVSNHRRPLVQKRGRPLPHN